MLGLDYASSSPGAAAVKQAGYGFVARYLSRYTAKTIEKPEYDDMISNGVGVVLVFEDYANQALKGYDQGILDAKVALGQANALGWPSDRPIHFAVDFDIAPSQKAAAGEYMKAIASVLGLSRTGAYGGYWWIKYCDDNNLAASNARWQAVAWSGGMVHDSATLFQQLGGVTVNGTSCDINEQLKDDFGQNGEVMSKVDINAVREMAYAFGGRDGRDGRPYALDGATDDDLKNHVGSETNQELSGWWDSDEAHGYRAILDQVYNERDALRGEVAQLSKRPTPEEIQAILNAKAKTEADLVKAQAEVKTLQDQNTNDVAAGNAFIRWIGKLFGGK